MDLRVFGNRTRPTAIVRQPGGLESFVAGGRRGGGEDP